MEVKNADLSTLKINRSGGSYNREPGNKTVKILAISAGIIILLVVIYLAAGSLLNPAVEIKTTTALMQSPSEANASLTASGYVVAQRKAAVASKGTGRLIFLGVVEGDQVKSNQVIGRLENNDIAAQLDAAKASLLIQQADLQDAKNNYERQKALLQSGSSTKMELDAAESRYNRVLANIELAKANIKAAEVAMENTLIRAPFDGTVLTKNAEVGEIVAPLGASTTSRGAVVTMADMKSLQVEVDVSESNIEKIKVNQECQIILDAYPEKSYPGFVAKVVPTADRSKATVLVKVGFKEYDSRVLPEMSAKVNFLSEPATTNEKPALVVPFTAVVKRNGKDVVYKIKDDKAVEVAVTKGRDFNIYTEITSGLNDGDRIIERVGDDIKNGTEVKVQ